MGQEWQRPGWHQLGSWVDATGAVRYDVLVDGATHACRASRADVSLPVKGLGDGTHDVQVVARDDGGQETASDPVKLKIDASAPRAVTARVGRRRIRVTVTDAASGVARGKTRISFGDGAVAKAATTKATHTYKRAGRRTITVKTTDKVGHTATWRLRVQVR